MSTRARSGYAAVALAALGLALVSLHGCASGCDEETIDRAVAFLDTHQTCTTNADCVTVSDMCEELPGGFCGQLPMNREGASSAQWNSIERQLKDCAPESCTVCSAALVPTCTNGACRGRE